ncbi:MAG: HD domain-containing protein [Candidatus Micrarchaeia archaeon]
MKAQSRKKPGLSLAGAASLVYEAGMLARLDRSGWNTIGISDPQNVSEHSFRVAVCGLMISRLEGLSNEQERLVLIGCLLHDLSEARIGDFNKINKQYARADHEKAFRHALAPAGLGLLSDFEGLFRDRKVADVINDADMAEMAACALEYSRLGNPHALKWVGSAKKRIKTRSGEKLVRALEKTEPFSWAFKEPKK